MTNRRVFLQTLATASLLSGGMNLRALATSEESFPFPEYRDEVTGARVRMLTHSKTKDQVVYQTHPQWTPDMDWLVFVSSRSGGLLPHGLDMRTGEVCCLVGPGTGSFTLARKDDRLFYQKGKEYFMTHVRQTGEAEKLPTKIADFPEGVEDTGEISIDCDERVLYFQATVKKEKMWAILALEIETGEWSTLTQADFKIGHVQANPFLTGRVLFCWETGGDAPQRTWVVEKGSEKRHFYKETFGEWVTHEVWWKPDRAVFTIWPYDDEHRNLPHGVASADLGKGELTIHSQYPAWHTHGSPDGKWIMGDDFDRNLWLIEAATGERRLLTQDHLCEGGTNHPHASFTPDSRSIVFTSSRGGADDIYLVDLPEWESLPQADASQ